MPTAPEILALTKRIARDPSQAHTTAELARVAGWSEAHLHRDFKRVTGETPKAWITRVRTARALELLAETELTIGEIASLLGFSSHEVLTRTFRRIYGVSPSVLRRNTPEPLRHAACLGLYHLTLHLGSPSMSYAIHTETRPAQPVLFMRRTVPPTELQAAMAECLPAVFTHCQQHGLTFAGPPYTRYVEMTRGTVTIEAGLPITTSAPGAGEVHGGELPAGDVAVTVHAGAYDQLGDAHSALEAWARDQGRRPAAGAWESYVTDPGEVPDPADWRTEVVLPLS